MIFRKIGTNKQIKEKTRQICLQIDIFKSLNNSGLDRNLTYNYIFYIFLMYAPVINHSYTNVKWGKEPIRTEIKIHPMLDEQIHKKIKEIKRHGIKIESMYSVIFNFFNEYMEKHVLPEQRKDFKPEQAFYDYMELLL